MRPTGRFSSARLIEVGHESREVRAGRSGHRAVHARIEAEFGPAGRAVVAWTGADVDHPIVRAARTNGSVLDAAQTVAAGALEALALGPRGEATLLWSDEAGGRGAASATARRFRPPSSCGPQRPLAAAPALRDRGPQGTRVRDVAPLAGLVSLEELVLASTPVADISPLAGLSRLRLLQLQHTRFSDLGPPIGLCELLVVNLRGTPV